MTDRALIQRAAANTIRGAARVTVTRCSDPDDGFSGVSLTGVVDFEHDRCELEGDGERLVLLGSTTYERLADGRWLQTRGEKGQRGPFDPRLLLGLLSRELNAVRRIADDTYEVALDHAARSNAQFTPLSESLALNVVLTLDDRQKIQRLTEVAVDEQTGYRIEVSTSLTPLRQPVAIDEPPPDRVVTVEAFLAESGLREDGR